MQLNQRAAALCGELIERRELLRAEVHDVAGATVIDLGVDAPGGLEAGRRLAEICMAGGGHVQIVPGADGVPSVAVRTDQPVAACMAAQYAGWQISVDDYFAMGSGPMRAAAGKEELFAKIGHQERPQVAVGTLETARLPTEAVCRKLAGDCGVAANSLFLLAARTASLAGTLQVVARSVETALHKLLELDFDLSRVVSGFGLAPLPPVAADDLASIGRTNDAVLYGGDVTLWVRGDDASLQRIGPRVPSSASADHGAPFTEIFERYDRDFYKIDPALFSPARITLMNLDSGRTFRYGQLLPEVLERSFS